MSNDVKEKLEKRLQEIELNRRIGSGNVLSHEDVDVLFKNLKKSDPEVGQLLEWIEHFVQTHLHNEYLLSEQAVKAVLSYYNIIGGCDILESRHQYFFTEERKLIKKPFFTTSKMDTLRNTLRENNIFRKIGINDEV